MSTIKQLTAPGGPVRRIITPITGALSLVIGLSGVMLFFHLGEELVKNLHEWLGMAFAVAILAHLSLNWTAFKQHFRKPAAWTGFAVVSAICIIFLAASISIPHHNPGRGIMHSIETAAISDLAPIFKISPSEMVKRLDQAGVKIETGRETIQELSGESGVEPRRLIAALTDGARPDSSARDKMAD
jgi:hypothetical protein